MAFIEASYVLIYAALIGFGLSVFLWRWLTQPDYSRMPKSPPRLPLLGNFHMLLQGKQFCQLAAESSQTIGNVFTWWFGGHPTVFIGDQKLATELFVNMAHVSSDRESNTTLISTATLGSKGIIFHARDRQHQLNRKIGATALRDLFSNKNTSCALMLDNECKRLLKILIKTAEQDGVVDPAQFLYQTTIRVMGGTCFGKAFIERHENVAKVRELVNYQFKWMSFVPFFLVSMFPLLRYVPFFKLNSVRLYARVRDDLIHVELKRHRDTRETTQPPRDVTDVLLAASAEEMDDDERVMVISDLIVAGSETVSTTLSWAILCLVRCPEWQVRLRDEIEDVVGTAEELSSVNPKSLPLLNAFYHEVQRWSSSVASSVFHVTSKDVVVGDYKLPKGTTVAAIMFIMHNDTKYWNDPRTFDPMRFINEEGEFAIPNKSFMPFSVGPRSCPGDSLAKREMFFVLLYLIYHVTFLPEEEGKMPSTEGYEEATIRPYPYKMRLRAIRNI